MRQYPKLKFLISQKQELKVFFDFLKESRVRDNRREMKWAFFRPHPSLKILQKQSLSLTQQKVFIQEYISSFYSKNINKIYKNTLHIKYEWRNLEKAFYEAVDKIFNCHPWPTGKYIAYPTIWGMYSRNIKEKTFQFPYSHPQHNYPLVVIAHEMLHFIFYDYFLKYYPHFKQSKYELFTWHISEVFNVVIQNSPQWLKLFKTPVQFYPEHRKIIKQLQRKYYFNNKDIKAKKLTQDIIERITKNEIKKLLDF